MITRGEDERNKSGGDKDLAQDAHFRHRSMPEVGRSVLIWMWGVFFLGNWMWGMLNIVQGSGRICSGGDQKQFLIASINWIETFLPKFGISIFQRNFFWHISFRPKINVLLTTYLDIYLSRFIAKNMLILKYKDLLVVQLCCGLRLW